MLPTPLVFEARCPLKVLDEACPMEICLPTSGPGPANTQTPESLTCCTVEH